MPIEWVLPAVCDLLKGAFNLIKDPVTYAWSSKDYAIRLQKEVDDLENEVRRVQDLAQAAGNNLRDLNDSFTGWKKNADKALEDARKLLGDFAEKNTCCYRIPDPYCRCRFSTKAEAEIEVVHEIAQGCIRFRALDDICSTVRARADLTSGFKFESRNLMIQKIMEALASKSNSAVGVYGMGGLGKSTLLDEVETMLREKKTFDWVAKADVSENPDIKAIQGDIADVLSLSDIKTKETISGRAELLRRRLEDEERKEKKVLIILDNLWKGLDLKSVGIPCGPGNKVKGCQLLLTSRDRGVLCEEMGCDEAFQLDVLKTAEAKSLFERIGGVRVHEDEFKALVDKALDKCGGVPFLIVNLAKRFQYADLPQWRDIVKRIEKLKYKDINDLIDRMLLWSYDKLEEEVKRFLWLCVVYGVSKPSLQNLVNYSFGLRILEGVDNMEDVRDRLSSHISTLQAASFLLDSEDVASLKIHDLVREFVTMKSSSDHPFLVLKDNQKGVIELPKDKLKSYTAACFPYVDIGEQLEELDCPEMQIFLLFTNDEPLELPNSYFNSMKKLMVLHLSKAHLTCSHFQPLENLRNLCLDGCSLEDVAAIGELKGLHILSFVNSKIERLPKKIGQLVELRLLDLNHCSRLDTIDPGVLGSLINLEELYMENSFDRWNVAGQSPPTSAGLIELSKMKNLCTLYASIPDPSMLPENLNVEKLTKYKIQIGDVQRWSDSKGSSTLEFKLDPTTGILQKGCIQTLLGKTDDLYFDGLDGIEESICTLSQEGFPKLKHLCVENSPSVHYILRQKVSIPSMESLTVDGLPNLQDIFAEETPVELSNLQRLYVSSCKSLSRVIHSSSLVKLHKLQTLMVTSCDSMQEIFCLDKLGASVKVETLNELNTIDLWYLPSLRRIWSKNPCGILKFHNLKELCVLRCDNLEFLFLPSMVQSFAQLRRLRVLNCKKMEAIIMEEEVSGIEISETLVFPMLTNLTIENLESLTCFSRTKCSREARSDNHVKSCSTALFNQEVSFPSLESLTIGGLPNLEDIFAEESLVGRSNLQILSVSSCKSLSTVFHSTSLVKLHKLHTLTVKDCDSVQDIFCLDEQGAGVNVETLNGLKTIKLTSLPSLRRIWSKNRCGILKFHNLKELEVSNCDNLEFMFFPSMVQSLAQLRKLKELEVSNCDNLEFMFFPSMVQSLAQLRKLKVRYCKKMKAIIMEEEGSEIETSEPLVFSTLTDLAIHKMESLTCFSRTKCSREARDEDCIKSCSTILFNQEIAFPSLETLSIGGLNKIEILWDNQVAAESFHKLKSVIVYSYEKLVNIIPSCILGQLKSLESLEVKSCRSLEVVFKLQPLSPPDGDPVAHFPLKKLELDELPELKCVWDKEFHSRVKFQFLRSVTVSGCKSLTTLFPTSVAVQLTHLEELGIYNGGIVEVIEKEGFVAREVFPRLTSLKLKHLAELRCIYARTHALRWPALKTLEMDGCDKVEIFASQPENEMPVHRQPFFLIEKGAFPNLQELKLDLCGRMEMWHGHFHDEEFFRKLRVLELYHLSEEFAISTCHFVQSLTNLEKLVVCESYLEKLSTIMGAKEGASLEGKGILPLSRFSQHLKTLDVSCCDELSNMFTPTIAGNLVELTKLRIRNCKMLTEVICDEGVEEGFVVAFNQLKYMELDGLTKLRCFSSIKYTMKFPLLEDVIVSKCPNMKFFSEGLIEAPKLERVRGSEETWFWKENLNITIQNMFEERAMMSQVKSMRLSEFPELIGKWHGELSPIKSSWQLRSLTVDRCPSFTSAIPSRLMLLLKKMERLQVRDCESLEEIFDLEGMGGVRSTRVLPWFGTLDLVNLPKLRRLWNKNLQGSLHYNLRSLTLYNCSNLRHAFAPSMAQCLRCLLVIVIKECGQMEGVIAEEEAQGCAVENIMFPWLWRIELECLPNLTSFLLGKNQTLECPGLETLAIAHCPKMRSLTGQSSMENDQSSHPLFTPQVQFPSLGSIVLSHMDNLREVWTASPQEALTFENLWRVNVENCKNLENLFPHWVATSLIKLQYLRVESCGLEEIVMNGDDTSHSTTAEFLFPKLTSLVFNDMPQLKSFCTKSPTLNWPCLKELQVTHCDKLSMLSLAASMNKGAQREDQHDLSDREAHFPFEMGIPERLSLVDKDIQMIQNGKFSDDIFAKLQALILACFHDENAVFPSRILLQRCQNLQSVEVFCSSFEDIFPDEGLIGEGKHLVFENLKELKLSKLHNLKHVWREDSLVSKILQSIETFEIWDCHGLTTLFPTVTSFQNLKKLVVKNSFGLINLIIVSAVMNLAHLTELTIIGCERMKEVVEDDENGEEKVISFRKLERLTLQQLPSLECFSSTTSCSFRFPFLLSIEVEECPKMKIFSKVRLNTPKLKVVRLFRYKWEGNWEGGDLNTTIQKLSA